MSNSSQINKLRCDFQDKGLPTSLCPYIGENFANQQILIISEVVFVKRNAFHNTANTPLPLYTNPSVFFNGKNKFLNKEQEDEVSVEKFVEDVRPYLTSGFFRSVNYNDINPTVPLLKEILYTLSKTRASIDDIAIHRFFLRPCIFDEESEIKNRDAFIENYFTEEDKIHSIKMLRNVIDTLCPQKVYFSSSKLANIISDTFVKVFSKSLDKFFAERQILTDLESPWDSDRERLNRLLNGNSNTNGQKRLRFLTAALVDIEEKLRIKLTESSEELNDLRAVIDNIKAIVSKHEDNLKNCGKIDKLKLSDEQMKERKKKAGERLAIARKSRWPKK